MKQKNGYTIPELLIVVGAIGVIALVAITKVSFAFSEINNTEEQQERITCRTSSKFLCAK